MGFEFNADDIFAMAARMEKNGSEFYSNAAKKVAEGDRKQLFLQLAAMEVEHERKFRAMRDELSGSETEFTLFDPEGESIQYLRALVDMRVFFEKEIVSTSVEDILKAAIVAEKDSIVFYLGMKELVPEKSGKSRMDAIIREEMDHIRVLTRELSVF